MMSISPIDDEMSEWVFLSEMCRRDNGRGLLIDTHDHPVCDPVWLLYRAASARFPMGVVLDACYQ
jgi:hypothetical protein